MRVNYKFPKYPLALSGIPIPDSARAKFKEVLGFANEMVKKSGYIAGTDHITLADLSCLASFSTMIEMDGMDVGPFPELRAWFNRVKGEVKNYEKANGAGAKMYGEYFGALIKAAQK